MNYDDLITKIESFIYENINEDISGDDMQMILKDVLAFAKNYPTSNYRNAVISLTPGTNTVAFNTPLGIDGYSYTLEHPYVHDDDGNNVDFAIPNADRTANGFKIIVPVACVLDYKATLI